MEFTIDKALEILERTPIALEHLLNGLSEDWTMSNEGEDTWRVYDVIGHLVHGDQTDYIGRTELILSEKTDKQFTPFNRFAQFENSKGKTLPQLLNEFKEIRMQNVHKLRSFKITETDLAKTGVHPAFGEVTLSQLLSTWVVHDLDHLAQVARIMAKQYKEATGPWIEYLKILRH